MFFFLLINLNNLKKKMIFISNYNLIWIMILMSFNNILWLYLFLIYLFYNKIFIKLMFKIKLNYLNKIFITKMKKNFFMIKIFNLMNLPPFMLFYFKWIIINKIFFSFFFYLILLNIFFFYLFKIYYYYFYNIQL